jgi:hypothetical protein
LVLGWELVMALVMEEGLVVAGVVVGLLEW